MRVVKKKVYYCEYCDKKKGLHPYWVRKHEEGCTANPNRKCGMCGRESFKKLLAKYLIDLKLKNEPTEERVEQIKKEIGCPACILALLRQTNTLVGGKYYDFKTERVKYWEKKSKENQELYQSFPW